MAIFISLFYNFFLLPIYVCFKYFAEEEFNINKVVKLILSFTISVIVFYLSTKLFFILFLSYFLFLFNTYFIYQINSDEKDRTLFITLSVEHNLAFFVVLIFLSAILSVSSKEALIMILAPQYILFAMILVSLINTIYVLFTMNILIPKLQLIQSREIYREMKIFSSIKLFYLFLLILIAQDNLPIYRVEIPWLIIIASIFGIIMNSFMFESFRSQLKLFKESSDLKILKEHINTDDQRRNDLREIEASVKSLRHDLKQVVNQFDDMDKNSPEFEQYHEKLKKEADKNLGNSIILSDHDLLNTYLYKFNTICEEANINFNCFLLWENAEIDSFDTIRLFSNILTNSLEAVLKVENFDNRYINVESKIRDETWIDVKITNPHQEQIKKDLSSSKDINRGDGIRNMKSIINSYYGLLDIEHDNNIFEIYLSIPMKKGAQ